MRLPLGMMNKDADYAIGAEIGEVLDVDAGADGRAGGKCLWVKVRMNIKNPLMRVFTLEEENEEGEKGKQQKVDKGAEEEDKSRCPFEYKYLPDFCYICGVIIGHIDKVCSVKMQKGE